MATSSKESVGEITSWRREQLVAAGFPFRLAFRVALRFDLHALLDLVDRGCPPQLAVRILAPVDEGYEAA